MKLWIDDVREPPNWDREWVWDKSVHEAIADIQAIETYARFVDDSPIFHIELISIDHDAGDYANDGGDYIKVLDWLEATGRNYPIHIHSMNPVGVQNMRAIIQHNNWQEVYHI